MNKLASTVDWGSGAAGTISLDDILRDITEAKRQVGPTSANTAHGLQRGTTSDHTEKRGSWFGQLFRKAILEPYQA